MQRNTKCNPQVEKEDNRMRISCGRQVHQLTVQGLTFYLRMQNNFSKRETMMKIGACSSLLCERNTDLEEERICLAHKFQSIIKGSQGKNIKQKPEGKN